MFCRLIRLPSLVSIFLGAALLSAIFRAAPATAAPVAVWTQHNDNSRTGQNLNETILTPSNVNQNQFGLLYTYALDDQSYGQPLYIPGVTMAVDNAVHNVVYVTTVNNSVYAFDGDTNAANGGNPLWHVNLTPAGGRAPSNLDMDALGACGGGYTDFTGKLGTVGTPVIDQSRGTLYVVSHTIENGSHVQRLHALDITSGAERPGSPVVISASYQGVNFDPTYNNQRPALALVNGIVYIMWSSYCDNGPYHGWVIAYDGGTLQQTAAWAATTTGGAAGIWQGGQGLTADATSLYLMTGNGTWDGTANFGESAVKLSPSLVVQDYFTPSNYDSLNGGDTDLGAAGLLGIPGTSYVFGGGKQGMVYLMNTSNMGKEGSTDNVVQEFQATFPSGGNTGHIHGGPVYFNNGTSQYIYLWGENDYCRAYQLNGTLNSTPVGLSTMTAPVTNAGMPGGFLSISANGTSNGILWALTPYNGDANHGTVPGILHAFSPTPVNGTLTELWNSQQNANRDSFGDFAKFTYPTISNGRVYVSTFGSQSSGSGSLAVYGLIGSGQFLPTAPTNVAAQGGNAQVALTWSAPATATSYDVYRGTTPGGEASTPVATVSTTNYTDNGVTNGRQYYYTVRAVNSVGTSPSSAEAGAMPSTGTIGMPYGGAPWPIPGTVQSENYDLGGEGVAYHDDDTTNNGGQYRNDGVDIENCDDTGGGYDVGWTNAGEWLNYTVNVATAGAYVVTVRAASDAGGGTFHIANSAGTSLTGPMSVPETGGWQDWTSVTATLTLPAGEQVLTLYEDTGGYNFNYMSFASPSIPAAPTGLQATAGVGAANLTWTASTQATSYNVYRGTSTGGESSTPIATGVTGTAYTDSVVTSGSTYYYTVAGVDSVGTSPMSAEANATPTAAAAGAGGLSIDCGGAASGSFVADTDFNAGTESGTGSAIDTSLLTGTIPPQSVLQSNRYGTCTYTIPGLTANGSYTVTLYFAESYWSGAGQRVFNVVANGTTELTKFDIYAAAGAQNKAVERSFGTIANANGQIVLNFNTVTDNAQVNAIVVSGSAPAVAAPTGLTATGGNARVTLAWTGSTGATSYDVYRGTGSGGESATPYQADVTGTTYTDTGVTNGVTYYYVVTAVAAAGASGGSNEADAVPLADSTNGLAIDCGGPAVGTFVADVDFAGGTVAAPVTASIDISAVTNPAPQEVYQTQRYGAMTYTIPGLVPGASYTVRLHLAETYWSGAGQRKFNVAVNGTQALSNFDIFAAAGAADKAIAESIPAAADANGNIAIAFTNVTDNATVGGIEIVPAYSDTTASLTITRSGIVPILPGPAGGYQILTVKNTGSSSISGPIELVLTGLPSGVTVTNAAGAFKGNPYVTATTVALAPGASVQVRVNYSNPSNQHFTYGITAYSGAL